MGAAASEVSEDPAGSEEPWRESGQGAGSISFAGDPLEADYGTVTVTNVRLQGTMMRLYCTILLCIISYHIISLH